MRSRSARWSRSPRPHTRRVNPQPSRCKKTETQAECHARLKCKADEELEDCQRRRQNERNAGQRNGSDKRGDDADERGRDRDADRQRSDERDRDDSDRQRGDRGDRGHRDGGSSSRRHRSSRGGHGFEANKTFGLGLELGEPTGLNGKYFVSKSGALDFGVGWIDQHYYYGDGLHLYADYLWHPASLVSTEAFELPFYIGAGLRYWDFNYCYQGLCDYGGSAIGIRIPFGISFDFNNAPLDIFLQLVPVIDFLNGDYYNRYRDREHFGVDLSAGIRFWFK